MRFAGQVAVVTGAASGIGKASVLKLASEGAHVFAADIDEAGGQALAAASNGKIDFVRCDVTKPSDIEALMNAAAVKGGGIDILFNNAAAAGDRAPIDEITPEGWDRTMDLVLKSVAMGIRYASPHMKGRKGASIVNTASVAALGAGYSPIAYAVAKAGVLHLSGMLIAVGGASGDHQVEVAHGLGEPERRRTLQHRAFTVAVERDLAQHRRFFLGQEMMDIGQRELDGVDETFDDFVHLPSLSSPVATVATCGVTGFES